MRSQLLLITAVLGTATCCPTMFLVVEKDKSAPRPWLPTPEVAAQDPIPQPAQIENRILLDHGKENHYPEFSDAPDLSLTARARSLSALRKIKSELGLRSHETSDREYKWVEGTLACTPGQAICDRIRIPKGSGGQEFYSAIEIAQTTPSRRSRVDVVDAVGWPDDAMCARASMLAKQCQLSSGPRRNVSSTQDDGMDTICRQVESLMQQHCPQKGSNDTSAAALALPADDKTSDDKTSACGAPSNQPNSAAGNDTPSSNETPAGSANGGNAPLACDLDGTTGDGATAAGEEGRHAGQRPRFPVCAVVWPCGYLHLTAGLPGKHGDKVAVRLHVYHEDPPELAQTLFTFIHITDAQVRDPTVLVGGRGMSHRLDWLVQSFEYNVALEFNDLALGEALVATINEEAKPKSKQGASGAKPAKEESSRVTSPKTHLTVGEDSIGKISMAEDAMTNILEEQGSKDKEQRSKDKPKNDPDADRPKFVIHTGDAIDSGVNSELRDFHQLIDRLDVPSYNVIGSHDVMAFGNLMPTRRRRSDEECATVQSVMAGKIPFAKDHPRLVGKLFPNKLCIDADIKCNDCGFSDIQFVAAGKRGEPINHTNARRSFIGAFEHRDYDDVPQPLPTTQPKERPGSSPSESRERPKDEEQKKSKDCEGISPFRPSRQHGFDLNREAPDSGYYAFSSLINVDKDENEPRKLVSIVLNTEDFADDGRPVSAGVGGRIGKTQMQWLRDTLKCTTDRDLVLVFGHVALSDIEPADQGQPAGELLKELNSQKNLIAYFYGHGHEHQICGDHKRADVCSKFWEIATASLLEFPQEARRVKIKYVSDGLAFLELVAFRERLEGNDERTKAIELARTAGERDWCYSTPSATCEDGHVHRTDGHDANARLWFSLPGN